MYQTSPLVSDTMESGKGSKVDSPQVSDNKESEKGGTENSLLVSDNKESEKGGKGDSSLVSETPLGSRNNIATNYGCLDPMVLAMEPTLSTPIIINSDDAYTGVASEMNIVSDVMLSSVIIDADIQDESLVFDQSVQSSTPSHSHSFQDDMFSPVSSNYDETDESIRKPKL